MKNTLIVILASASIAFGGVCTALRHQLHTESAELAQAQTRLAALETQLKRQADAVEEAKLSVAKAKLLQRTLTEASAEAVHQSKHAEQLKESLAAAKTNNPMQSLAAMFKNPEMRKMMEAQQKAVMGPMITKQYADLFKQLNLTPGQTDALKTLLQNKMLANADAGMSLMDSSLDSSQRDSLVAQIKSTSQDYDNQIQQLLGDQNYQAYQAYTTTIPARTTIGQFGDQLAGTADALSPNEQQQLIQAMTDATSNYKWTAALNGPQLQNPGQSDPGSMMANLTEDNINQAAAEGAQFDQQFFPIAQQILTPSQATAFQQFQNTWRQMQTSALKMAAQMVPHSNP